MKKEGSDLLMVRDWFYLKLFSSSGDTPLKQALKVEHRAMCGDRCLSSLHSELSGRAYRKFHIEEVV